MTRRDLFLAALAAPLATLPRAEAAPPGLPAFRAALADCLPGASVAVGWATRRQVTAYAYRGGRVASAGVEEGNIEAIGAVKAAQFVAARLEAGLR